MVVLDSTRFDDWEFGKMQERWRVTVLGIEMEAGVYPLPLDLLES
jgi:hypothetical protein